MEDHPGTELKNILYVEDHPLARIALGRLLKHYPVSAACVSCGESALAYLNSASFDVCIFDLGLPDIDGLKLTKIVKEIDPNLPVIIISGGRLDESREATAMDKNIFFVSKPFDISDFVATLQDALALSERGGENTQTHSVIQAERRGGERIPAQGAVSFCCNVFANDDDGGAKKMQRRTICGELVDKSAKGCGLKIESPLRKNAIISLLDDQGLPDRIAVAKWASDLHETQCRVGIKFI